MTIYHGDCLDGLRTLGENSVDAIVTDPPYGLSFMGKKWDYDVPSEEIWRECLRVLKPGGHLLAFAGTRTQHRMAVRIEDAGFEIRDCIMWVHSQGFPKSLDVSKAIDKEAGAERSDFVPNITADGRNKGAEPSKGRVHNPSSIQQFVTRSEFKSLPLTDDAKKWDGWGTALKPALEPITVARKPLSEKTVAANVLKWGTGAINIDGGRVRFENGDTTSCASSAGAGSGKKSGVFGQAVSVVSPPHEKGRFPANICHDGSDEVLELFPAEKDKSAARFFYCAKASKKDRGEGNTHCTVKPTDLMRYLVRLVTPPGGVVLDPFMGSGSTGKAARLEGFHFIGIEREAEYVEIAKARIGGAA